MVASDQPVTMKAEPPEKKQNEPGKVSKIAHLRYDREIEDDVMKIAVYNFIWVLLFTLGTIYTFYAVDPGMKLFVYLVCSGGIGGTLYNIWHFSKHYYSDDFDPGYRWSYYFRPVIAAIIGLFTFYLIIAGALSISGIVSNTSGSIKQQLEGLPTTTAAILIYCAFSFIAGYSANGFMRKLDLIAQILLGDISEEDVDELKDQKVEQKRQRVEKAKTP